MIHVKYLKITTIDNWLRRHSFSVQNTSLVWNGFIRILSWISSGLGWRADDGVSIKLDIDPIAGTKTTYILSRDLLHNLNDSSIYTLSRANNYGDSSISSSY